MRRTVLTALVLGMGPLSPGWTQTTQPEPQSFGEHSQPERWIPVLELPTGWLPQAPVDPQAPWWHAGFRITSQLIGNPTGGASHGAASPWGKSELASLSSPQHQAQGLGQTSSNHPAGGGDRSDLSRRLTIPRRVALSTRYQPPEVGNR